MKIYDKKKKRLLKLASIEVEYNVIVGRTPYGEKIIIESYDSCKEANEAFEWMIHELGYDYVTRR